MSWFKRQRVQWIAESVWIFGFINREHIMKKFEVGPATAAADLRAYREQYPHAARYNKSAKRYECTGLPN